MISGRSYRQQKTSKRTTINIKKKKKKKKSRLNPRSQPLSSACSLALLGVIKLLFKSFISSPTKPLVPESNLYFREWKKKRIMSVEVFHLPTAGLGSDISAEACVRCGSQLASKAASLPPTPLPPLFPPHFEQRHT